MSRRLNPKFLREQYGNALNLNARVALHQRFSTNKYDWQRWVFDRLRIPANGSILELGCGPGYLWSNNRDRLADAWKVVVSDLSPGMLGSTKANLQKVLPQGHFTVSDIHSIPFEKATFDVVIANHMLYHVQDRKRALSEVDRVLKGGGYFYAATNGQNHMVEVLSLLREFDLRCEMEVPRGFSLENGVEQLSAFFSQISLQHYEDELVVTEAEPLAAYAASMQRSSVMEERRDDFVRFLEEKLAGSGAIRIQKATGLFEVRKGNGV